MRLMSKKLNVQFDELCGLLIENESSSDVIFWMENWCEWQMKEVKNRLAFLAVFLVEIRANQTLAVKLPLKCECFIAGCRWLVQAQKRWWQPQKDVIEDEADEADEVEDFLRLDKDDRLFSCSIWKLRLFFITISYTCSAVRWKSMDFRLWVCSLSVCLDILIRAEGAMDGGDKWRIVGCGAVLDVISTWMSALISDRQSVLVSKGEKERFGQKERRTL
jgi:hypothetical protein